MSMQYELKEHEQRFVVHPIGIKYICEFCNEGEMAATGRVSAEQPQLVTLLGRTDGIRPMFEHRCDKCSKTMMLPRQYPKIEWEFDDPPAEA